MGAEHDGTRREVEICRVGLARALSREGNSPLSTVLKIANALGLKVSLDPLATNEIGRA